jgi:CheY-like chemotaxis protein
MKRILIINDEAALLRLMKQLLVDSGNNDKVETTTSAVQAQISIETARPRYDLVIVEINTGGVQAFRRIIALALTCAGGAKILVTSADVDTMDDLIAAGYTVHGLINLPWGDSFPFIEIVDQLLGRKTKAPRAFALN